MSTYPLAHSALSPLGTGFSVSSQETDPQGITWDGTHFWVLGDSTDTVYKYTSTGTYTGTGFKTGQSGALTGVAWDGTNFWLLNRSTDRADKYEEAIGIPSVSGAGNYGGLGGQNYVRVK